MPLTLISLTTTDPAPMTVPEQIFIGKIVEFEPIETLSSNKHFSHNLESFEGPFFY